MLLKFESVKAGCRYGQVRLSSSILLAVFGLAFGLTNGLPFANGESINKRKVDDEMVKDK